MNKAGKYRRKKIKELYSVLASGKPLLSAKATVSTGMSSNSLPVNAPKANTFVHLNKKGLTGVKSIRVKNLRVGKSI